MNWLANELNIQPSPVDTRFDQRIPFMRNRTTQLMLANFAITDDRRKDVDFAGPYMLTRQTLMVRRDEKRIRDYATTKGRKVCVPRDTTSQDVVDGILKPNGAIPQPLPSIKQCVADLEQHRADAVLTIDIDLIGFATRPEHRDHVRVLDLPHIGAEDRFGIGLPNGDKPACEFLTAKLRTYLTSGGWDAHFKKNFPGEDIERFKPDPNNLDPCE
jgi:glutamate transport system substrate-binding protein